LSKDELEKENDAPVSLVAAAAVSLAKMVPNALRAETKLQSFVDTLIKLNQKVIEDCNTHKCDAEDVVKSLKYFRLIAGLFEVS
jgi:hypothetical protein